jgi:ribosomal protein S18 acetylase RimI-like enzyme
MPGVLREAAVADVEALFAIRTSVTQNHLSRAELAALGITPSSLAEMLRQTRCAWLVENSSQALGFAMVDAVTGELFALFVRPEWAGQGIGSRLLAAAENSLFQHHSKIHLITDGDPAVHANPFYRRHGWHLVGAIDERDVRYEKYRPS